MSDRGNHAPSFQAARLFRKTSANGNTYFTGRLGGARVTLLKSRDVADDGGEIWSLMLAEAPQRPQEARQRPGSSSDHQRARRTSERRHNTAEACR